MLRRYNGRYPVEKRDSLPAGARLMKIRALLLSFILAGATLSISALAQDASQQSQTPSQPADSSNQTQSSDQTQPPSPNTGNQDSSQPAGKDKENDPKAKHDGGKKDVDAIGNRKVGGLDWYSIETDIKIGKSYAQQLEASMKMIKDPVVNEYVNRIGQNLVRNSDAKVPFTIKVVDADDVNAMALPGGFFYVNSGLILAADDEAELAAVMAHEIAHVALRHGTRGQ